MQEGTPEDPEKTCGSKYGLETKYTYVAGTGNRTRAHCCIAPEKNRYATCFSDLLPSTFYLPRSSTCFFGAISKGNLPIPLQKVKFANKVCVANFINAIIYTRNPVRIRLWALIDFSKVCPKSKGTIWFWNQNTWETPFTFAGFNYVIF